MILLEVRQALRGLLRTRRLTLLIVATLAIGVCGPLVVFSVVNATFLRALPFQDEAHLVRIASYTIAPDGRRIRINVGDVHLIELLARARGIQGVVGYEAQRMTLADGRADPERLHVVNVVASSWSAIGVAPWRGRLPTDAEAAAGIDAGVGLVSHSLWQRRFAANPDVPHDLLLDGVRVSVVGVMPPGFRFPYDAEVWLPQRLTPTTERDYAVFARPVAGEDLAAMNAELQRVASEIRAQYPGTAASFGLDARPIRATLVQNNDRRVFVLAIIVALLLSIACINATSLLLARTVSRQRELAVRAALGASRLRRARLVVVESVMLSTAATIAGWLLALWCGSYASLLIPSNLSGQLGLAGDQSDGRFALFALVLAVVTGILAGLAPAVAMPDARLLQSATHGARDVAARRGLALFVAVQTALAFVLLGGGLVLVREAAALARADLGFEASHLWSFQITLPVQTYPTGRSRTVAAEKLMAVLRQQPGVMAAAGTTINPLAGPQWRTEVVTPELEGAHATSALSVNDRLVTPGWFETVGMRLVAGRPFLPRDDETTPPVVVISQRLARHLWPSSEAVGKRIRNPGTEGGQPAPWRTVVGVVSDIRDAGDMDETWYVPFAQRAGTIDGEFLFVMMRTRRDAPLTLETVRRLVRGVDPGQAVSEFGEMSQIRTETLLPERLSADAVGLIAGCGLLLTCVGAFGASNYAARQAQRELSVRRMLGATTSDLLVPHAWRSIRVVLAGIGAGEALTLLLKPLAVAFGLAPTGRLDALGIGLLLLGTSVGAAMLPAWRGSRVDPMAALRQDG